MNKTFSFIFLTTSFALLGFTKAETSEIHFQSSIKALEEAVTKFGNEETFHTYQDAFSEKDDLHILRKPWISQNQWEGLSQKYFEKGSAEALFRMARHAYILGFDQKSHEWIQILETRFPGTSWHSRGAYLEGLLALKAQDRLKAMAAFASAAFIADTKDPVKNMAIIAQARVAYDAGQFKQAKELYMSVPLKKFATEDFLDELAWTNVKLKRPDLAATDVHLLFTLHPESDRLPLAARLLGKIYEDHKNLREGARQLEKLSLRFYFEEKASYEALVSYKNHEEELIAEFDPTIIQTPPRAILPPIAHKLLEKHPVTQSYIAELSELKDNQKMFERGLLVVEASRLALKQSNGTTIESVSLLEWANDIEQRILGVSTKEMSPELSRLQRISHELQEYLKNLQTDLATLKEIERHIWLNWVLLGGEREQSALQIKQKVRNAITERFQQEKILAQLSLQTQALSLRIKRKEALKEALRLKALRVKKPEQIKTLLQLDELREKIIRHEPKHNQRLIESLPQLTHNLKGTIEKIQETKKKALIEARGALKKVLKSVQTQLAQTLSSYHWSIAEAYYKLLKNTEKKLTSAQTKYSKELAALEQRYKFFGLPYSQPQIPKKLKAGRTEVSDRIEDILHFQERAKEFSEDINIQVQEYIKEDRLRYEKYALLREQRITEEIDLRRQEAISAYGRFTLTHGNEARTPYALYRLAQLHYERVDHLNQKQVQKGSFPKDGESSYEPMIAPLERIQHEFQSFPHRDSALYLLGYSLLDAKKKEKAVQTFEQLISDYPKSRLLPEVELRVGEYYFQEKAFDKAIAHYHAILKAGFNYFYDKALYKLAWSNYLLGRYDSAIAYFLILLDYSEELPQELRDRYIQFSEEAIEYVAFSLFRSGGITSTQKIFGKIGWKPFGVEILKRVAQIYVDRSQFEEAIKMNDLALLHYPLNSDLSVTLENKIKLLEQLRKDQEALEEKERALALLSRESTWRRENNKNSKALQQADRLLEQVYFSLATQYDVLANENSSKPFRQKAKTLYQEVIQLYPNSIQAYNAHHRLAEIAFLFNEFNDAISNYDTVVRNNRFNHHFNNALYGIVVCHEKILLDVERISTTKAQEKPIQGLEDLLRAATNFSRQAPRDPRVPEVLFRGATIATQLGNFEEGRKRYVALTEQFPDSSWTQSALLATVDSLVTEEKWQEASQLIESILKGKQSFSQETKNRLAELKEGASFKLAESYERQGKYDLSVDTFLNFQKSFPSSRLASIALFNAFTISKREMNFEKCFDIISLLTTRYPKTKEASTVQFESALILDSLYEIDDAISAYEKVIHSNSLPEIMRNMAFINLAQLVSAPCGREKSKSEKILPLLEKAPTRIRSQLKTIFANQSEHENDLSDALKLWEELANDPPTTAPDRAIAAAHAARILWETNEVGRATKLEKLAAEVTKKVVSKEKIDAQLALSLAQSARIEYERKTLESYELESTSFEVFSRSLKKRLSLLNRLEKSVLSVLKFHSLRANAFSLYQLGLAYNAFIKSLEKLSVKQKGHAKRDEPKIENAIFTLKQGFEGKKKQASSRAFKLLIEERLSEPYLPQLAKLIDVDSVNKDDAKKDSPSFAKMMLPLAPTFLKSGESDPAVGSASYYVEQGIQKAKAFWPKEQRRQAREDFSKALLNTPNFAPAVYNLAILNIWEDKWDDFDRSLSLLERELPQNMTKDLRFMASILKRKTEPMVKEFEGLLEKEPRNQDVMFHFILALLISNQHKRALFEAKKFIRWANKSVLSHRALAACYYYLGEVDKSRFILLRAYDLFPKDPSIASELALTLSSKDDLLLRSILLREAQKSGHPEALANWAQLAFQVKEYENAKNEWELAYENGGLHHPTIIKNLETIQKDKNRE